MKRADLDSQLQRAQSSVLDGQNVLIKLREKLVAANKKLHGLESNLKCCQQTLKQSKMSDVVQLYFEDDGIKIQSGEYTKNKYLVDQNKELVIRVKSEIRNINTYIKNEEDKIVEKRKEIVLIEKSLSQYGIIKELNRA